MSVHLHELYKGEKHSNDDVYFQLYKPEKGIMLSKPGLRFVRAIAVKEGRLNSHVFTSK